MMTIQPTKFNADEVVAEFKAKGYNVTKEAVMHNYEAWLADYKSGYLDKENGYFLFSACRHNPLYFYVENINGQHYQKTYIV